ncbi:site-specific integrase [Serratia marcescens]|uniref:tyrosine-type recombinase/integrase n=1 Tax=Serratia marcescens TaxID=615 RepID=UPI000B616C38|nr:tyrosine-type recombinase/integrase [Serratia marcescens]ASM07225.1 hypothetical protein BVG91_09380 [Serratia marcescens]
MIDELIRLSVARGRSRRLKASTVSRVKWSIKSAAPVLSLGVRAAGHPAYWERHARKLMEEGKAATTIRAELNELAALFKWILNTSIAIDSMKPASVKAIESAIREVAKNTGRQVKRFKPMQRPSRVSIDEFKEVVNQIESLKSPYKEAARLIINFGFRTSEAIKLHQNSIINGRIFVPDRTTKTCADLLLPVPEKHYRMVSEWLVELGKKEITYAALLMNINRAGFKWRCHDLRKLFRTNGEVRGEDYLAMELILNHSIKDVPATYIQNAPYKKMKQAICNAIDEYLTAVQ